MAKSIALLALVLLALVHSSLAHELCLSTSGPINVQNTFCSGYNNHTCCTADADAAIASLHASLAITSSSCNTTMAALLCAQCDPWGAHIFGIELQIARPGTQLPYLCPSFANEVYAQCAAEHINWPQNVSPFGGAVIGDTYANETAFCDEFCAPAILGSFCFNGTPYTPTYLTAFAFSGEVCFTYWSSSGGNAIHMQDIGDGTMLVVFKNGDIHRRNKTTGEDLGLFMHIPNVYDNGEAGLLSIALHPSFLANGRFFAYYSQTLTTHPVSCTTATAVERCGKYIACDAGRQVCTGDHVSVVSEFQSLNQTEGLANSSREVLYLVQPYGNHNGGLLLFDPEGFLMIFLGDGGNGNDPQNRSQDPDSPFGKILRIDVDSAPAPNKAYAIPATNPGLSTVWPEVFVRGFRNPWRASFDSADPSRFFVADVGQDTREEVDLVTKGGNYGWRKYEGFIVNPSYPNEPAIPDAILPIMDYDRSQGTAVIGGHVYRGRRDLTLLGRYVFGDLSSGLFIGSENSTGSWVWTRVSYHCGGNCPSSNFGLLYSFYEDHDGDVYAIGTGGIFRLSERAICGLPSGNSTLPPPSPSTEPPSQSPSALPTPAPETSITTGVTAGNPITIGDSTPTSAISSSTSTGTSSPPVGTENPQSGASLPSAAAAFVLLCAGFVLLVVA